MSEGVNPTMDIKQVAKAFDVSEVTIRRWVQEKKLIPLGLNPHLKKQRKFEFDRREVEALLARGRE